MEETKTTTNGTEHCFHIQPNFERGRDYSAWQGTVFTTPDGRGEIQNGTRVDVYLHGDLSNQKAIGDCLRLIADSVQKEPPMKLDLGEYQCKTAALPDDSADVPFE